MLLLSIGSDSQWIGGKLSEIFRSFSGEGAANSRWARWIVLQKLPVTKNRQDERMVM